MADQNNEDEWETDEEDEDYVPPDVAEASDDEISDAEPEDDEEDPSLANPGHKRRKGTAKKTKKRKTTRNATEADAESEDENKSKKVPEVDEKKKMDSLWADFLSDTPVISKNAQKTTPSERQQVEHSDKSIEKPNELLKMPEKPKKVTVTELFEFAGETVEVQKEVDQTSPEAKKLQASDVSSSCSKSSNKRPSAGIGSILQQIGSKKGKLSVLDKTKLDWNTFKKDEGIEEDLKIHNKGKDGYLDKLAFLERTDLRQFEIEKRIRTINRSHKS